MFYQGGMQNFGLNGPWNGQGFGFGRGAPMNEFGGMRHRLPQMGWNQYGQMPGYMRNRMPMNVNNVSFFKFLVFSNH